MAKVFNWHLNSFYWPYCIKGTEDKLTNYKSDEIALAFFLFPVLSSSDIPYIYHNNLIISWKLLATTWTERMDRANGSTTMQIDLMNRTCLTKGFPFSPFSLLDGFKFFFVIFFVAFIRFFYKDFLEIILEMS